MRLYLWRRVTYSKVQVLLKDRKSLKPFVKGERMGKKTGKKVCFQGGKDHPRILLCHPRVKPEDDEEEQR